MDIKFKVSKEKILKNLRSEIVAGRPIIGSGAGVGLIGRIVDHAGIDLIVVYNSGYYRMNGHSSILGNLPVGDANQMVMDMGEKMIIGSVERAPVVAGIYGIDPTRDMYKMLCKLAEIGYSGVINYPTVGKLSGKIRLELEQVGLGIQKEISIMKMASKLGFLTMTYVFTPEEAGMYARAGMDIMVAHAGLTMGGYVGLTEGSTIENDIVNINNILKAGLNVNPDIVPLCHGGAIVSPKDAKIALEKSVAVGFVGASSIERIPIEKSVSNIIQEFKNLG